MSIDLAEVIKLANLARIKLSSIEQERLSHELGDILNYVSKISELTKIAPVAKPVDIIDSNLRDDLVIPDTNYQAALQSASGFKNNLLEVPPVFTKEKS